jgi:S-adenosylmethionine hydrolase
MGSIITLTTDFGLSSNYAAAMKGVILNINPEAKLVDVCHIIEPQNIVQAAFTIGTVYEFFPPKTVHLVVVDPGVGTGRRAIILRTPQAFFVAPDNGVLSVVMSSVSPFHMGDINQTGEIELSPEFEAIHITRSGFWRTPVSPTFHGRDIFAPVAARLSLGYQPLDFGERIDKLTVLSLPRPGFTSDGALVGRVLYIDSFGNITVNIKHPDLPHAKEALSITVSGKVIKGLVSTYAEGEGLLALIGSSGYLEIAFKNGNAAALLNAKPGDKVVIRPAF